MPYFDAHWHGHPYRHLPTFNLPATPSTTVLNRSNAAAEEVTEKPLEKPLQEARKRQRHRFFRIHRRRGRSSRASTARSTKHRAAHKAKKSVENVEWVYPTNDELAELDSNTVSELYESKISTRRQPRRLEIAEQSQGNSESSSSSEIRSFDGAGNSVVESSSSWATKSRSKATTPSPLIQVTRLSSRSHTQQRLSHKFSQLSSSSVAGEKENHIKKRVYDHRIDAVIQTSLRDASQDGTASLSSRPTGKRKQTTTQPRERAPPVKPAGKRKQNLAHPQFWEALDTSNLQGNRRPSSPSVSSLVHSLLSEQSRSPSQKRAIRRYTREIALYLQAVKSLPKQSFAPSISETVISANTLSDFKPYHSEFRSAGLAVTSKEQRGLAALLSSQGSQSLPPTPTKDERWESMAVLSKKSIANIEKSNTQEKRKPSERGPPSFASGSTGTTIIGFTPTHEKSYPRPKADRKAPSIESDHTVIAFSPVKEKMPPPWPPAVKTRAQATSLPPKFLTRDQPSPKRSLPWLRRNGTAPATVATKKLSIGPFASDRFRDDTAPQAQAQKSTPANTSAAVELDPKQPQSKDRLSSATKWREPNGTVKLATNKNDEPEKKLPLEPTPLPAADLGPNQRINDYVSTAVQASISGSEVSTLKSRQSSTNGTPNENTSAYSGRSRRSSIYPRKYRDKFTQSDPRSDEENAFPFPKISRSSKVKWQGVEGSAQAEDANDIVDEEVRRTTECLRTNPFVNRTSVWPSSPVDGAFAEEILPRSDDANQHSHHEHKLSEGHDGNRGRKFVPPNRRPPSPPLVCCDCAGPVDKFSTILDGGKIIGLLLDYSGSKAELQHACRRRSSIVCQQCLPTRHASLEVSPLQENPPVEVSYFPNSRRSTRPTIPAGPVEYTNETIPPPRVPTPVPPNCLDSKQSHEAHRQLIQETIETYAKNTPMTGPMKQPSARNLKLRYAPQPETICQRTQPYTTLPPVKSPTTLNARPIVIAKACPLDHVASASTSVDTCLFNPGPMTDKQVFRGLQVATAAACDEDVDKWIEEIIGTSIRKFLADLSAFEGLGVNTLANVAKRAAKHRRDQVQAWEEVRETNMTAQNVDGGEKGQGGCENERERGAKVERFVIGDQGVVWLGEEGAGYQDDTTLVGEQGNVMRGGFEVRDEFVGRVMRRREFRESEGVRGVRGKASKINLRERTRSSDQ